MKSNDNIIIVDTLNETEEKLIFVHKKNKLKFKINLITCQISETIDYDFNENDKIEYANKIEENINLNNLFSGDYNIMIDYLKDDEYYIIISKIIYDEKNQ